MENRIDAIYARQSVDRKDSISIETPQRKHHFFCLSFNRCNSI